jgi:tetratricopeptide (TPR) repeat protein
MRRACWIAGLLFGVAPACDSTQQGHLPDVSRYVQRSPLANTSKQDRMHEYTRIGVELYQKGDYLDARDCFTAALKLKPGDPNLLYNRGECWTRLGNRQKAEEDYRACLGTAPGHVQCRHALIVLLAQTQRGAEAQNLVTEWINKEPNQASGYIEDGWLLRYRNDLPHAEVRLWQALDLEPNNQQALTELALTLEALQRPDRALVLYQKVLERKPGEADVVNHVNVLLAKGVKAPRPE